MPRLHPLQTNFTSGEWSSRLEGRVDLQRYENAVKTLRNMTIHPHGGASRRPGTRFVAEVKTSANKTRLIPFEFSDVQAYVIEAGNLYFRFYKDGGRIESPPGTPVEIVTPYATADLPDLRWVQSADTLYLFHPKYMVRKLTRTSHTVWTITEIEFTDGPYLDANTDTAQTITPSATTGNITLTSAAAGPVFQAGHVGALWRITHGGTTGYVKITAFTSATSVSATVKTTLGGTTATSTWREGAFSSVRGFPRVGTFYEERLVLGATDNQPQTLWGSKNASWEVMTPGTASDDPFVFTLAASKVNVIRWIAPARLLLVGTLGGEWRISGGGRDDPVTPTNITARPETTYGSAKVAPVRVGNAVLFFQRSGRKFREFSFNVENDAYQAPELSILAEHLFPKNTKIDEMAWAQEFDPTLWCIRSDGKLLGFAYERLHEVFGWHQHDTDGTFESVVSIPHPDGDREEVWVIANRTIGGATKRYIEVLEEKDGFYGPFNVDSGLAYSGAAAQTLSGLSHLNGKTVKVVGGGAVYPDAVVSGGAITLVGPAVTQAEVGLSYTSTIETLRPEVKSQAGSVQSLRKRWNEVVVRLFSSLGDTINGDQLPFRKSSDAMDKPPALFSGDKLVSNLGWDREGRVKIEQTQPLPLTVLAITGTLVIGD